MFFLQFPLLTLWLPLHRTTLIFSLKKQGNSDFTEAWIINFYLLIMFQVHNLSACCIKFFETVKLENTSIKFLPYMSCKNWNYLCINPLVLYSSTLFPSTTHIHLVQVTEDKFTVQDNCHPCTMSIPGRHSYIGMASYYLTRSKQRKWLRIT